MARVWVATFAAYAAAGALGLLVQPDWAPVAVFWPAAGIAVGALAVAVDRGGWRPLATVLTAVGAACVIVHLVDGMAIWATAGMTAAHLVQWLVASLVFVALRRRWPTATAFVLHLALAAAAGSVVGVLGSFVTAYQELGHGSPGEWTLAWLSAGIAGPMIGAPLLFSVLGGRADAMLPGAADGLPAGRRREAALQLAVLVALIWFAYGIWTGYPLSYVPLVGLIWSATRLGIRWTALAVTVNGLGVAMSARSGLGPFGDGADLGHLALAMCSQLYLVVAVGASLVLAAVVAERERATRRAQEHLQLYDSVFEARDEGVVLYDDHCMPMAANAAALGLMGVSLAQLRAELPLPAGWYPVRADGSVMPLPERPARRVLETLEPVRGAVLGIHHPDGHIGWLSIDAVPLVHPGDDRPWAVVSTIVDITRSQELDRAKEEFVSIVSHELRTPLTSVRGSLGLLAAGDRGSFDDRQRRLIDIATGNVERLARLVDDLLDIERLQAERSPFDVREVEAADAVRISLDAIGEFAESNGVRLAMGTCSGNVVADLDRVVQILTNLVSNAVKFSPLGSLVTVSASPEDDTVVFTVEDHGRGIPSGKLDDIFERFVQVDASDTRDKGGSGLGLAICKDLVERQGGRIWVESELGRGSTFSFTLPMPGVRVPVGAAAAAR